MCPDLCEEQVQAAVSIEGGQECVRRLADLGIGLDAALRPVSCDQAVDADRLMRGGPVCTASGVMSALLAAGSSRQRAYLLRDLPRRCCARLRSCSGEGAADFLTMAPDASGSPFNEGEIRVALK